MTDELRLMAVMAHPDDETLGVGGALARYAAEGIGTYLVMATRGERGWTGPADQNPGLEGLGKIREAELLAAADVLGLREVKFLDYIDGDLDQADAKEATRKIVGHIRRVRPQVVLTFDPQGAYGHPDHIAICQFTAAATVCAADANYRTEGDAPPHRVDKLYYMALSQTLADAYIGTFGDITMTVDGVTRRAVVLPDWAITTRLDATAYWQQVWKAVACHRSQIPNYEGLQHVPEDTHHILWGMQEFSRVYSTVNGGRDLETDLFAGLR